METNFKKPKITAPKTKASDFSSLMFGKIPPQAREMEEVVLGALMIDKEALNEVLDILKSDVFYVDAHCLIFKAIIKLFEAGKPIDLLTVTQQLRQSGDLELAGGPYYLSELTNKVASSANIEYHARIVIQKYIQRRLIVISNTVIKDAYEDTTDVLELLDKAEQGIFSVAEENLRRGSSRMTDIMTDTLKEISEAIEKRGSGDVTGVPSGYTDLDRITSGWQRTDLIIVAARPAMGKTAFVLSMARFAAVEKGIPVAIFSLEMNATQLVKRLISADCEINAGKIMHGDLNDHEWSTLSRRVERLSNAPIFISDLPALNILEFRMQCRRLKSAHDIQLVMIDYLQLMSGQSESKGSTREQEISNISRSLKSIAKELGIPVIALSQLSRAVESRTGEKKPQLSDLRESGAIEQDADLVLGLYRPEYYGMTEDSQGNSTAGMAEVIIMKNRHGSVETVRLGFINHFAKFTDYNPHARQMTDYPSGSFSQPAEVTYQTMGSKVNDTKDDDGAGNDIF
jgi:replicative DNA helicase